MSLPLRVLVISAHPDDESFGCGGTLLRHKREGSDLHWIVVTDAWEPKWSAEYRAAALRQTLAAGELLGASLVRLQLPTTRLSDMPLSDIIGPLQQAIANARPDVVYTVGPHDIHTDHAVVFRAATIALKPTGEKVTGKLLSYEIPSSTEWAISPPFGRFEPTVYVDITRELEGKLDLVRCYASELKAPPHPRSIEGVTALARVRGSAAGVQFAEAFQLHREIR